jgi:deoxyribonuclease IV
MIRFGPAGIPLSCKGRTLRDGISDIHALGLTAIEVQFIKVNAHTRPVSDEEVGKKPMEIPHELLVEVALPGRGGKVPDPAALRQPLSRKSDVTVLSWFLAKDYNDLVQARVLSRAVDVHIAMHAPYYVDLASSPTARERSLRQFRWSAALAQSLGAEVMVGHLGFYGTNDHAAAYTRTRDDLREIRRSIERLGANDLKLGIEPSGHPEVMGTRDEVLQLARDVKGVVPVLNLAHIAARENNKFDDKVALGKLVADFLEASRGNLYLNFSGVEFFGQGEFRLTPIKRGAVHFDAVADVLAERDYDGTVISSSPLLEHDAMYMKLLYERALAKRFAKKHAPPAPATPAAPSAAGKASAKSASAGKPKPAPATKAKPSAKGTGKPKPRPAAKAKPKPKPKSPSKARPAKKGARPSSHARKR